MNDFLHQCMFFSDSDVDFETVQRLRTRESAVVQSVNRGASSSRRGRGQRRGRGTRGARGTRGVRGRAREPFQLTEQESEDGWVRVEKTVVEHSDVSIDSDIEFTVRAPGARNLPPNTLNPIDFFMLFLTREILLHIVKETNRYVSIIYSLS